MEKDQQDRIIVVSNRLPLKVQKDGDSYTYAPTSGGLVTGLKCAKESMDFLWLGCLSGIPESDREEVSKKCAEDFGFFPVFIEADLYEKYYNRMCNGVLWPLFHSFSDLAAYSIEDYIAYKQVNAIFTREILKIARDGDKIWIHDYHLMLVPKMLRESSKGSDVKIGFFLHIPFPCHSLLSGFSLSQALIRGILGSDLVGFHAFEDVGNFASASGMLGCVISSPFIVERDGRSVHIEVFPIGIDPTLFLRECLKESTKKRVQELKQKFENKKILLGVDRIDYIKGIPHRIKAFSKMLKEHPELAKDVVFFQLGVPSRMDMPVYAALARTLCSLSGEANSKRGSIEETNIYFINKSVPFSELCALYMAADVCVISSLRDGLNLVSLEYVACSGSGALVMSEYAGAAGMLVGAVYVNPWDITSLSRGYIRALNMPEEERIERKTSMQRVVSKYTAVHWAQRFIGTLKTLGS
uniref:Trehalose-6-phosphate synthase 2 n=1 Tax=Aleuroglyphus ovatus TaxID=212130 RepID=A0A3S8S8A4_ALEOV|nr:trehalose-6-phosphate synthase 2 [Aleuroglyphus ovatus]